MANRRRKFDAIHKIKVDGMLYDDAAALANDTIVHFYENLYHEDQPSRIFLDGIVFTSISLDDARDLENDYAEEEVWNAINELGNEKAPAPDGFNLAFFQHCWSTVKEEVMGFFADFHNEGVFEKSLNATFISLILKVAGEDDIKFFRPISLVGSVYKILAKVLASRLRKVVGKIVGPLLLFPAVKSWMLP